jgi:hypothetical protein
MVRTAGLESAIRPDSWNGNHWDNRFANGNNAYDGADALALEPEFNIDISRLFLRFANIDNRGFELLNRYETALWRQICQVIFTLDVLRRRNLDIKWLPRPTPPAHAFAFSHDRLWPDLRRPIALLPY